MESKLKVFQSLNCPLCQSPYSKSINSPKRPSRLWCGKGAACQECFEKEKSLSKKKRQHQCGYPYCYCVDQPAFYLIEILNNSSIVESPNSNGYLLAKSLDVPECPLCTEEYSMEVEERKPFVLRCGHSICHGCFMFIRTISGNEMFPHRVECPRCNFSMCLIYPSNKNPLQEFLLELPEMAKEMELNERKKCEEKERQRELIAKYREKFRGLDEELMEKMTDFEQRIFELISPKEPKEKTEKESREISENE